MAFITACSLPPPCPPRPPHLPLLPLLPLLLLLALAGCYSNAVLGFSDSEFEVSSFSNERNYFELVGSRVSPSSDHIEMTHLDSTYRASALWYKTSVFVRGFETTFSFKISGKGEKKGAQGIVFAIQNSAGGVQAQGGSGAGLGYASPQPAELSGIANSLAFEFDCVNDTAMNDPSTSHLSIHTRRNEYNSANENLASIFSYVKLAEFCKGAEVTVTIKYEPGFLTLSMTPLVAPILDRFAFDLEKTLELQEGGKAWIGFTSSTGASGALQEILEWRYSFLGRPSGEHSTCSGGGLEGAAAASQGIIIVSSRDQYGNRYEKGGAAVTASWNGPGTISAKDVGGGNYSITFSSKVAGAYSISALMDGVPIACIPASLPVIPAPIGSETKTAGVLKAWNAGAPAQFLIQAADDYGNLITTGGEKDKISVQVSPGDQRTEVEISDLQNGTYLVAMGVYLADSFEMRITASGKSIIGSPFHFQILPAELDPPSSVVEDLASVLEAGREEAFRVVSKDRYGNRQIKGGGSLAVLLDPSELATVHITDQATGIYNVKMTLLRSGKYEMNVTFGQVHVQDSPFPMVTEPSDYDAAHSIASGEGLLKGFAGVMSSFSIIGRDRYNNTVGGTLPDFDVVLVSQDPNHANITGKTEQTPGQGMIEVTYLSVVSGNYLTHVTSREGGVHVVNSPASTWIQPAHESAEDSYLKETFRPLDQIRVEEEFWGIVQAVDKYGNKILIGGLEVTASVTKNQAKRDVDTSYIEASVKDHNNGTYRVSFSPTKYHHGDYTLVIQLEGTSIKGSPFSLNIRPIDKRNTVLLAVCLPAVFLCLAAIGGLVFYRRWKKKQDPSYLPLPTEEELPSTA